MLSEKLAHYIKETSYDQLPEEVISFTKLCILDYFSSAFAGSKKEPVQIISEFVNEMGGDSQASLITGGKSSVTNAALVNGAASHIVELDDIHKSSIIHAATVVIPAALAVAEWKKVSGKDFIAAVVVGYEVCYRIGEAVSLSHYYYWHSTATCGTFGAAAAVAKLLDLSIEHTISALGNAGTQAAGLWEFIEDGANTKQLHPGKAAMNGVISSLLAQKGFTGAKKILEGNRGFFEAMSNDYNAKKITDGLGETYKIMENSFKIHASCRHTHHAMDLMAELTANTDINILDIKDIKVKTYQVALNITNNNNPTTQYSSKFSLQYCTALALVNGKGGLHDFNEENLWNEEIRSLMSKVQVEVDPVYDKAYPEKWGAVVEINLINGESLAFKSDFPKGDPENPVTQKDLVNKFEELAKDVPVDYRKKLVGDLLSLETLNSMEELLEVTTITN